MVMRFSTVEKKGSAELREIQRFCNKFYTEDGIDLVGNNTPVFFFKAAKNSEILFILKKGIPHQHEIPTMMGLLVAESGESAPGPNFNVRRGNPIRYRHHEQLW
jgi:catalase